MAEQTTALSSEEFQRIQESLLELRTSNYQLAEQSQRKDREIAIFEQKVRKLEDELQKALRNKRSKGSDSSDYAESDILRQKLATQEEEFRLQQATLMAELQRVIGEQEELEQQVCDLKDSGGGKMIAELEAENARLKNVIEELTAKCEQETSQRPEPDHSTTLSNETDVAKLADLETALKSARNAVEVSEREKKAFIEKLNIQTEEFQTKSAVLQKEIFDLKEQLRRKQASYVSLTEEKERQLEEFKKSLDNMVQKKDSEIKAVMDELNGFKRQLQMAKDTERLFAAEKASLETAWKEAENQARKVREQNEGFQIRLQETNSANDCLSNQLQEARNEVERMQQQLETARDLAAKRKTLLDEMSEHLEKSKEEFRTRKNEMLSDHKSEVQALTAELEAVKKQTEEIKSLEQKVLLLESLLQTSEDRCKQFEMELDQTKSTLQTCELTHEEKLNLHKGQFEREIQELRMELEIARSESEHQLLALNKERDDYSLVVQELKQEIRDKEDGIKAVERKHQSLIKDLKRQLQLEKKRSDNLQEKLQDVSGLNESGRNRSPGNTSYEEIRPTELADNRPKVAGDAASVSSWTVVGANAQKESDRQSIHTGDRDSESSITMLESDNQELINRLMQMQKKNFELQERITLLEESSSAMAEDLVNKATVIEQFLKEKSGFHLGQPSSPEKLPPGLKKMIDLMKIDMSAGEIRDMNKRLQHMLEETLTKNMHLQQNLETMSQELARLKSSAQHEHQRLTAHD